MMWQELSKLNKVLMLLASMSLGASLYVCDQFIFSPVLLPEFGLLIFFVIEFGLWVGLAYSGAYLACTLILNFNNPSELFQGSVLLIQTCMLAIGNRFARQQKYLNKQTFIYFCIMLFSNAVALGAGLLLLQNTMDETYRFMLSVLATQSFFLVLTYTELVAISLPAVVMSLLLVFVIILSLLHMAFLGMVFILAYLGNYYFKGFFVSLVSFMIYIMLTFESMSISINYLEILCFISLFIAIINLFRVYKDESQIPVDLNWLTKETEGVIKEIAEYKQLASIINYSETVAFLWRADGGRSVEYVSDNAKRIMGYNPKALISRNFFYDKIIFADDRKEIVNKIQLLIESEDPSPFEAEYRIVTGNGEINWVIERSMLKFTDNEVTHVQGTIFNITNRKEAEERLHRLTYFDELTGVHNRVAFIHALQRQIEAVHSENEQFAVMHIDIDQFKQINENFGYACGDQVMCTLAARLKQLAEHAGMTFARMANNNFNVLCKYFRERETVEELAEQLLKVIAEPIEINGREYSLSASIGVSIYPTHGKEVNILIANAEAARRKAKEYGNNNYMVYDKALHLSFRHDIRLIADLKIALEQEQFLLMYQPKVDLKTGEPKSVEALLRWEHPERGRLTPDKFIGIAEVSGLIVDLTEWILKEACKQLNIWRAEGLTNLVMAVNLSARQFWDPKLVDLVEDILKQMNIPPDKLELEITESMVMRDPEQSRRLMLRIQEIGVQIAVDDFGVGHSSLHQLKHFPFDTIKIDRSFIQDLPDDRDDCAIVKAIIDMGHSLSLNVVAEGVETIEQVNFLREFSCNQGQGYYFAKPLSPRSFDKWYKSFELK